MPRITIVVDATAGSRVGRASAVGHSIFARTHQADGWPIGWGQVADTIGEDGRPLSALVLMTEPALPGRVPAWPVGLIQIEDHAPTPRARSIRIASARTIVTCVEEAAPFLDLIDLAHPTGWHAEADDWLAALRHLQPHLPRHARTYGSRADAEALITAARHPDQPPEDDPSQSTSTPTAPALR